MASPHTVPAALRTAAQLHGDRPAVVDGAVSLSFRELHEAVRATARGYLRLGLRPGDAVCIWAPNSWEWIVAGLAISYASGVLVPANTRYKGAEVAGIVARPGGPSLARLGNETAPAPGVHPRRAAGADV